MNPAPDVRVGDGGVPAKKVHAFALQSGRHARLAEQLLGAPDPVYAIASLLVDHEARLDALSRRLDAVEARDDARDLGATR